MKKTNIGILTPPMGQANIKPLSNLVTIAKAISNDLCVIVTCQKRRYFKDIKDGKIYGIIHRSGSSPIDRALRYIWTQIRISWYLINLTKYDLWIFYIGDALIIPMITAKVLRKKVVLAMGGFMEKEIKLKNDYTANVLILPKKINLFLSNKIIVYFQNLIKEWGLEKYEGKIYIAHEHFLDFDKLKIKKKLDERDNLVGYIGRLSREKGISNFVEAIPEIMKRRDDLGFLVGGDGQLREKIEEYLNGKNLNDKVKLVGWIPYDKLSGYLNELQLLILPSYTEGLPNIMLEAMACGTPVLATPVGGIPDIIKDEETGFIMENNSPECIAKNIIRALNHPDLEQIAQNARALVEREFTFEKAVEAYRKVLSDLTKK